MKLKFIAITDFYGTDNVMCSAKHYQNIWFGTWKGPKN